jgi:predicted enzyme related to lactoylglutathione lyase
MGKRTKHEPGTFSWTDLATTDPDGAKRFYGELFGWEAVDMPIPEGGAYTMLRLDGDNVAALYELSAEMREQGAPPNWTSYVTVYDVEATVAKARELGATILMDPFDVMEAGRMTLFQDPTGAVLAAWQPRESIGATRVNDFGCMTWNELATPDSEAAAAFYSELFGWEIEAVDTGGGPPYSIINNGGRRNGGMMERREEGIPPFWTAYFTVASADDAAARASELGGETHMGPMDVGAGRIAVLGDPQGAVFAVFQGETDD